METAKINDCADYVDEALTQSTLFTHMEEHTLFQIVTLELTVRVNHGKTYQRRVWHPKYRYCLPRHRAYQIYASIERAVLSRYPQGILGGTVRPTHNAAGAEIMEGLEAILGTEEYYRVAGPFDGDFPVRLEKADVV